MEQAVIVTGATGFLGSHLVKQLLSEGHHPIVLKRSFSNLSRLQGVLPQVRSYDLDVCDLKAVFEDCGPVDAVLHVATNYGAGKAVLSEVLMANTLFPLQLLETAIAFDVPLFLNTDSYFNSGKVPYKYKYLPAYSLSKKQFAEWGRQASDEQRILFVNIKLHHMFGPGDGDSKFTSHIFKSCSVEKEELEMTPGEQKRDFIYIDDVVSAYMVMINRLSNGERGYEDVDLGCGQAISVREFVQMVHRLSQSRTRLRFGALPYREHEIMHAQANIEPLQKLGWKPSYSLEEGIRRTIAWYRQVHEANGL